MRNAEVVGRVGASSADEGGERSRPRKRGEFVEWQLVDPNGVILLDHQSHLYRSHLAGAPVGRYKWDEETLGYIYLM